ncbi:probable UDP-3-O-acyl-N-acetylglucosamine deacetylase 1, mitochondrial [Mercurialis annua]|uniref:probable UDP-3-O-acyl-N-acetylglucosamine deacetylase 1, mitochondrial n=1 Tax=Mercurialis annua TaxID=3986 RepID=UPI00215E2948|nr:probable UDP-3-O-acyl-N-acetylglucosamine deacetylase 1, mitochondrial [Mercurialis annua]
MNLTGALKKSTGLMSWKSTGKLQQTISRHVEVTGNGLHSGKESTVRIWPEKAGIGRYFDVLNSKYKIPAFIDFAQANSVLCTTLHHNNINNSEEKINIRTVEHLLSALEATGVDNCRIQIFNNHAADSDSDSDFEVPILDGSARGWVEAIKNASLTVAVDSCGNSCEKLAPFLNQSVWLQKNDSFLVAFPSAQVCITYGIDFPQVPVIGHQWFSVAPFDDSSYSKEIAASRTFCIYEEVERMREMGLIKGGSVDNAMVCSASKGWLNPPLRFSDEPCRHKILDLVGDFSLLARLGNQGLPVAHIVAYKGGHALHADFVRRLNETFTCQELNLPSTDQKKCGHDL